MSSTPEPLDDLIEKLAAIEHERWAHWQKFVHTSGTRQADGSLILPPDMVERWQRQIETPYSDLSDAEKASDREQVSKYLPMVEAWFLQKRGSGNG
ncbi:hypothetical protein HFO02_09370 [Rhizobium laguerreae]|uniref:hypothetical protein n=1 Tax=Rhizobium laguerreae TaxID=1076926 RepID=UPI001C914298|nr:hypothetical protein [Rhizobium laguerreae]MBY3323818.1 hypothetical protein [Rhizobium laguerreae]